MENNHPHHSSMRDSLLKKIEAHEVSMRPKIYYSLQVAALVLLALAVLVVSIFVFNYILFTIRISNQDSFLGFGPRGIWAFIYLFPWWLLLVDVTLVYLLERVLRQFKFGYRSPVLYLLLGLFVVTGSTAFALDRGTTFNDRILIHAEHHGLPPPFGMVYTYVRHPLPPDSNFCTCVIEDINGNILFLRDANGSTTFTAKLPLNDPRATTTFLREGDTIFIAGDLDDGAIRAFGIRKIQK